jgi:glycosyltransferase involved in cell wall biosynthesis
MSSPLISVIIPVYNQSTYILEAISSVLAQTVLPLEIIVIDDGSDDDINETLESVKNNIVYYRQSSLGASAARNKGVEVSQGEWLAFLDADDLWAPIKLEQQLIAIRKHNVNISFSHIEQFISPELLVGKLTDVSIKNKIMPGYCASTMLIKKDIFYQVGEFNPGYRLGEFIAWFVLLKNKALQFHLLDDILAKRRVHRNNTSTRNKSARQDYLKIFHEMKANA